MKPFLFALLCLPFFTILQAQNSPPPSPIIFIYDASGSMWGQMEGKTKMEIAANVMTDAVNKLPDNQELGLVAYGHRKKGDCEDVEFLVAVGNGSKSEVNQSLKGIKPLGKTPLAYSALQVIDQLRTTKMKATIILVTDGIESCGGNICEVIRAARAEGIDFKLHIIGFGLKEGETEQLKCAAEAGNGNYYDAADAGGLGEVLEEATGTTIDEPIPNISIYAAKNGKGVDAAVNAVQIKNDAIKGGVRTYQDTGFFYLPPGSYNITVRPLEGSDVAEITLPQVQVFDNQVIHKDVSFDGGKIAVNTLNNGEGWDAVVKIFNRADGKPAAGGRTYGRVQEYELNAGIYDVEVSGMKMKGLEQVKRIENIEVVPQTTQTVEHNFKTGIAMIGVQTGNELVDAVVKIKDKATGKGITGSRTYTSASSNPREFLLNPGTYTVSIKALGVHKGHDASFTIVVKEGETVEKVHTF